MEYPHRLLIVDDSKLIREGLKRVFSSDDRFHVVGEAANGKEALKGIEELKPDLITLDINMPEMDGITTLKHLMIMNPTPTVMLSTLSSEGAEITFDALRFGAVDFIQKPDRTDDGSFESQAQAICDRLDYAASVEVDLIRYINTNVNGSKPEISDTKECKKIVAVGAAEGGYSSLLKIIPHIDADTDTACLVCLYVPEEYIEPYVEYLNNHSKIYVKKAEHNDVIKAGTCYVRSGADYMSVHKSNDDVTIHISPAPFSSRKGSIDMLLFSTADVLDKNSIGIVLSGSGSDGSEGLEEISRVGGISIVQDPKTCLSKEMPELAIKDKDINFVISDYKIADVINDVSNI